MVCSLKLQVGENQSSHSVWLLLSFWWVNTSPHTHAWKKKAKNICREYCSKNLRGLIWMRSFFKSIWSSLHFLKCKSDWMSLCTRLFMILLQARIACWRLRRLVKLSWCPCAQAEAQECVQDVVPVVLSSKLKHFTWNGKYAHHPAYHHRKCTYIHYSYYYTHVWIRLGVISTI